jgi:hypothetical protein
MMSTTEKFQLHLSPKLELAKGLAILHRLSTTKANERSLMALVPVLELRGMLCTGATATIQENGD